MKKKFVSILLTISMAAALLSGCGSQGADPGKDEAESKESAQEESADREAEEKAQGRDTEETGGAGEISGTITFWGLGTPDDPTNFVYPWMLENIKLFEEKYPDCKVEATWVANGDDYLTKLSTILASGEAPDVFRTYVNGRLEPYVTAGKVLPIDHLLETYPETASIMNENALASATFDGKAYAIPLQASSQGIFYNKKIFKECNVEVPTTYEELLAAIDTFNEKGITPFVAGISDPWPGTIPYELIYDRLNGVEAYEEAILNKGESFGDESFVKAGEIYKEMLEHGMYNEDLVSISDEEARVKFSNGEAAMKLCGTYAVALYGEALGEDAGIFNFPDIEGGKGSSNNWILSYNEAYAISSETKNQAAAEAFVAFIYSQDRQAAYAECGDLIACKNVKYDESKLSALAVECLQYMAGADYAILPWDVMLGTDVGAELNNTTLQIIRGGDPAKAFGELHDYAMDSWAQ